MHGMQEVTGSNPVGSIAEVATSVTTCDQQVGASFVRALLVSVPIMQVNPKSLSALCHGSCVPPSKMHLIPMI